MGFTVSPVSYVGLQATRPHFAALGLRLPTAHSSLLPAVRSARPSKPRAIKLPSKLKHRSLLTLVAFLGLSSRAGAPHASTYTRAHVSSPALAALQKEMNEMIKPIKGNDTDVEFPPLEAMVDVIKAGYSKLRPQDFDTLYLNTFSDIVGMDIFQKGEPKAREKFMDVQSRHQTHNLKTKANYTKQQFEEMLTAAQALKVIEK